MTQIIEGQLTFCFQAGHQVEKYDDWSFYRNQFQPVGGGSKGVDVICLTRDVAWLLEVTDYRNHKLPETMEIAEEFATKVRDTLAGLAAASKNANNPGERSFAREALKRRRRWRVALHLEQPNRSSHKRPFNPANLMIFFGKEKRLKAIDAHPIVCSLGSTSSAVPWTAS